MARTTYEKFVRKWASTAMLGYLKQAYCRVELVHRDPIDLKKTWADLTKAMGSSLWSPNAASLFEMDAVVSAADGVRGLLAGRDSGAISALAIGRGGTFARELPQPWGLKDETQYLVFAFNSGHAPLQIEQPYSVRVQQLSDTLLPPASNDHQVLLREFVSDSQLLNGMKRVIALVGGEPTVGCLEDSDNQFIRGALNKHFRVRTFAGSSVAAALAAMTAKSGMHAFVGVARPNHAVLIAACARAVGAPMLVVPVRIPTRSNHQETPPREDITSTEEPRGATTATARKQKAALSLEVAPSAAWGAHKLVHHDDVVFIATGITENVAVRGVRYLPGNTCSTHSLVLSGYSGTARSILTRHDLAKSKIRWTNGELRTAGDLLNELKTERNWH